MIIWILSHFIFFLLSQSFLYDEAKILLQTKANNQKTYRVVDEKFKINFIYQLLKLQEKKILISKFSQRFIFFYFEEKIYFIRIKINTYFLITRAIKFRNEVLIRKHVCDIILRSKSRCATHTLDVVLALIIIIIIIL